MGENGGGGGDGKGEMRNPKNLLNWEKTRGKGKEKYPPPKKSFELREATRGKGDIHYSKKLFQLGGNRENTGKGNITSPIQKKTFELGQKRGDGKREKWK